jgi:hypothetical protein
MSNFKCNTCQLLVLPDLEQLEQKPESNFLQVLQNNRIGGVSGQIPSDDQVSRTFLYEGWEKSLWVISPEKYNVVVFIPSFVLYCPLFPLVRTTIYYSEMLIFSSLMPFSRSK